MTTTTGHTTQVSLYEGHTAPWAAPIWVGCLYDFYRDNGLTYEELTRIERCLDEDGVYLIGGGAAGQFTLTRWDRKLAA